jgi:EAL domain-containing protein (putative c-di-GMP-specific phosphodiesterase class I)
MTLPLLDDEPAYGPAAVRLLKNLDLGAARLISQFVDNYSSLLPGKAALQTILARLTPAEQSCLRAEQIQYLHELLVPDLDFRMHQQLAARAGRTLAMVGAEMWWITEANSAFREALQQLVFSTGDGNGQAQQIMAILKRRLLLDLMLQSEGHRQALDERLKILATLHQQAQQGLQLVDFYQSILQTLASIEGVAVAFVARTNGANGIEIESLAGRHAQALVTATQEKIIPTVKISENDSGVEGVSYHAWKTGTICIVDAYQFDPLVTGWRSAAQEFGFRSAAAIPLLDEHGKAFALIGLANSWPGFFSGAQPRVFLESIQRIVQDAALRYLPQRMPPYRIRKKYCDMLQAGQVKMLYQPIIELATGKLVKVEVLARLLDVQDHLISPAEFLPALGDQELLTLFKRGLLQACGDLKTWRAEGLSITVALNLPPKGIADQAYHAVLFDTLEHGDIAPNLIELEILEAKDIGDNALQDIFYQKLRALGIGIVQDDLGSGHSSLLRMNSIPFDAVKIDQGLVLHSVKTNPRRAVLFIYHLTNLAHALGVPVTVEGLEHEGLIEAATMLGADFGQGYGIGRPMPASALASWLANFRPVVNAKQPRTELGAIAGDLLWSWHLKSSARYRAKSEQIYSEQEFA